MKKFLLSFALILAFTFYTLLESNTSPAALPVNPPAAEPSAPSTAAGGATAQVPSPVKTPVLKPRTGLYADGVYTGSVADAYYGNVQVRATVQSGRITSVQFLDYPHDRGTSLFINSMAMPRLISEAVQAQSAKVDIVSGATDTSMAFQQSLGSALSSARNS